MKFLVIACLLAVCLAEDDSGFKTWKNFKTEFRKLYSNPRDHAYRMKVFLDNRQKVQEHNALYEQGLVSYKLKINEYSDLNQTEINQNLNGYKMSLLQTNKKFVPPLEEVAAEVDWRSKGAVTPVKNQGMCGSCWAFSTTGALEGQHFLKTGKLVSLSEQNLIDCTLNYGNSGCKRGYSTKSYQYIKNNGGIDTEDGYPYIGRVGKCKFNKQNIGATDSGYVNIPSGNEDALKKAVAIIGPISVAIDAEHFSFHHYGGGIYSEEKCGKIRSNHLVLVVGYGTENGKDYWLVKNSWGESWGEQGYIKMSRNKNNQCGIATYATYPTV